MIKFIFQFLAMGLFWRGNAKAKKSMLTPSSWLLGLYLVGTFLSLFTLFIDDYNEPFKISFWIPVLLFFITLIIYILPFRLFNEAEIKTISLPSRRVLDVVSSILMILSFYAIVYFSTTVVLVFSMGDLGALRDSRYATGEELVETGIMNTIASVSASLYVFAQLFFFIYVCLGGAKIRCALLLLASLSEPMHVLCYVGRDGIVFWILSFVFLFLLFKPFLQNKLINRLKRFFIIGSIVLLVPFYLITAGRFDNSDMGVGGSVVSYMGQQFINGPLFFNIDNVQLRPWASFPLVREVFGLQDTREVGIFEVGEWKSYGFSTFLSSFYVNFGFLGMYLIAILSLAFFMITVGKCKRTIRLQNIIIYILYFQIFAQGIFYFRQSTRGGNLFILLSLLMAVVFKLLFSTNRTKILRQPDESIK